MSDRFVVGAPLGRWQTNCYIVGDRDAGTCVVIDPGENGAQFVPTVLERHGVTCEAILVTHGHIDHFWAVPELGDTLDVPIYGHPGDKWLWENPVNAFGVPMENVNDVMKAQFGLDWHDPVDRFNDVADHQKLTFCGIDFQVRHNPGHTPGHVTFLGMDLSSAEVEFAFGDPASANNILFSGDLVFAGSIGRTDFPRGSTAEIYRSLVDTVVPLEDDTLILSGHGPDTTVGQERATNPFIADALRQLT